MNEDVLNDIKNSMISHIIFYGMKFDDPSKLKDFVKSSEMKISEISDEDIQSVVGKLSREIYQFKTNNFPIRNFIRNEWKNKGYEQEAEQAFTSVNSDEILIRANLLGVAVETFEEANRRYAQQRVSEENKDNTGIDIWMFLVRSVVVLIVIGAILRLFGFTEGSNDKMDVARYKACKDAGDLGDRWDCEAALEKAGLR